MTDYWLPIVVAAAAAIFVAVAGLLLTPLGPWYYGLKKPRWQPPDWLFGPAWTLIFTLAATAGVMAWNAADTDAGRRCVIVLFAVNGALNMGWSALFFTLRRPDWSLIEVAFLWLSIVALIAGLWRLAPLASLLLVPYLAWVSFASVLNRAIVRLNAPFNTPEPP